MDDNDEKPILRSDELNSDPGDADKEKPGCWQTFQEFPKTVFCIFGNEFCERFSYYGMRTVLTLYLVSILQMGQTDSVALFHGFIVLCYATPILGSILADGYIGKFHTILWVSMLYACGNILLAVAASFSSDNKSVHPALDLVALVIIGFGTGGIKPCVAAFGGDQFQKGQERLLETFFSVFYFFINAGSVISTFVTPILRARNCNGEDTCFPAAFGLPAVLMVISIVCFVLGSFWYRRFPPKENIIASVAKVIFNALRNKCKTRKQEPHWLDHYMDTHSCDKDPKCTPEKCQKADFVNDVKALLKICIMYLPVPVFWALYDQQGSRWILQAVGMDGRLWKGALLLPDQMTTLNALLILVFIPIFQGIIYPLVRKCGIEPTPLRRMVAGGLLAAVSFIIAMFVQFAVNKTLPDQPASNEIHMGFMNSYSCDINVTSLSKVVSVHPFTVPANSATKLTDITLKSSAKLSWKLEGSCISKKKITTSVTPGQSWFTVFSDVAPIKTFEADLKKPVLGEGEYKLSLGNFITNLPSNFTGTLFLCRESDDTQNWKYPCWPKFEEYFKDSTGTLGTFGDFLTIKPQPWRVYYSNNDSIWDSSDKKKLDPKTWKSQPEWSGVEINIQGQGGIYSFALTTNSTTDDVTKTQYTIVPENSVSILWQVPQYMVITAGEILFSITGLEFSYSQAPRSMKSVVQAIWLLTIACGDLIVVFVTEARIFENVAWELLLFAILMVVVVGIFALLAHFWYEYVFYPQEEEEEEDAPRDVEADKPVVNGVPTED